MTPRQNMFVKAGGVGGLVLLFGMGASWADARRDVSDVRVDIARIDRQKDSLELDLTQHIANEAAALSDNAVMLTQFKAWACYREHDPLAKNLLGCPARR